MKYGKLEGAHLVFAPSILTIGNYQYVNPSAERLADAGYLPIVNVDIPDTPEGCYAKGSWKIEKNEIVRVWELIPYEKTNELTQDDMLEIIADHEYRLCLMELGVSL